MKTTTNAYKKTKHKKIKEFFDFIIERQNMWHKRFVQHKTYPFSKDQVLAVNKFTNIYRQLDRTSLWVHDNIVNHYTKSNKTITDKKNAILSIVMFRWFNNIKIHEEIGILRYDNFDLVKYEKELLKLKETMPLSNSAAYLTPCLSGRTQLTALMELLTTVYNDIDSFIEVFTNATEGSEIMSKLRSLFGIGSFMAYEMYCDIVETGMTECTLNSVISKGPGSNKGMYLIFDNHNYVDNFNYLFDNQHMYTKRLKFNNYLEPVEDKLSLRVIEHSLCEFMKYKRLQAIPSGKKTSNTKYKSVSDMPNATIDSTGMALSYKKPLPEFISDRS